MSRLAFGATIVLAVAACSSPATVNPTAPPADATVAPAPTRPTQEPATSEPATPEPTAPAGVVITGYGATEAEWAAGHVPDTRYEAGCCWDPTLGLGPDPAHNAKYYGILVQDGRLIIIEERLRPGTSIKTAEAAARAEFPPDVKELWRKTFDTCLAVEYESATLARATGNHGRALVTFESGDTLPPYDPSNVTSIEFDPDDSPTVPDGLEGC
jgi:hypothetical protein